MYGQPRISQIVIVEKERWLGHVFRILGRWWCGDEEGKKGKGETDGEVVGGDDGLFYEGWRDWSSITREIEANDLNAV